MNMSRTNRRKFLIASSSLGLSASLSTGLVFNASAQSGGSQEAEQFMAGVLDDANTIMALGTLQERLNGIQALVDEFGDLRRTGRFTLGQYARQISDEQAKEFYPLFTRYATAIYQQILSEFSGNQLSVTGSIQRNERDFIVNSRIINAKPGSGISGTIIQWRLLRGSKGFKIVDAGADNIWLAIEQRSQFTSIIANNGGGTRGIDVLINQLKARLDG